MAGGQKPSYYHDKYNRNGETITISNSGAYAGFVSYWNIPIFCSDSFSVDPKKNIINIRYLYYCLKNNQKYIYSKKKGAGIQHVYGKDIGKLMIPIPSKEIQEKIVNMLDKFEKIINDISEGLPAEIHAREKQYEYYRNKLLTFKELV